MSRFRFDLRVVGLSARRRTVPASGNLRSQEVLVWRVALLYNFRRCSNSATFCGLFPGGNCSFESVEATMNLFSFDGAMREERVFRSFKKNRQIPILISVA